MQSDAETLPVSRFSTDAAPPHERHELWRTQGLPPVGQWCETQADPGFAARSKTIALGALTLNVGQYGTQRIERSPALIRRAPVDHLRVLLPLDAGIATDDVRVVAGAAILFDLAAPWRHRSEGGVIASIAVPRALALARGLDPRALHGTVIAPRAATLLREHVLRIAEQAAILPRAAGEPLAGTILDLLKVSLLPTSTNAPPMSSEIDRALRHRAERLIAAALEDPRLHADHLARTMGISRTRLYRLFKRDGGIQRWIRCERLKAASVVLAQGDSTLDDLAIRFQFNDHTQFSRAFRSEFGLSPRAWRMLRPE